MVRVIEKNFKEGSEKVMLCKVVYFDEDSVTDFVQIVAGGELEKTTELLNQSQKNVDSGINTKAGIGLSGVFKALMGFEGSASVEASMGASFNSNEMAKNIVKNTILTDFMDLVNSYSKKDSTELEKKIIKKFSGYTISAPKDSLSYIALISPYLTMLKSGSSISAGEFNIAIDKLDNTMKNAKGYYEFLGEKKREKVIFRFNIKAFKNNYKAPDLLKMDMSVYGIKVGKSNLAKLNFNGEFELDGDSILKDNPEYIKEKKEKLPDDYYKELDVYDVLLAGVEING